MTSFENLTRIVYEIFVEWFDAHSAGPPNGYDVIVPDDLELAPPG